MRRIYVCDTPYQIFNMMNIRYHADTEDVYSDIVLVNQFSNFREIIDNIRESNLFDNVYECKKVDFKSHINVIERKLFHLKLVLNPHFSLNYQIENFSKNILIHYDEIYATYPSPVVLALLVNNRKAKLYKVEDGTGSYILDAWRKGNPVEIGIVNYCRGKTFDSDISLVNNVEWFEKQINRQSLPLITNEFINSYFQLMNSRFIAYKLNIIWMTDVMTDRKNGEEVTNRLIDFFDKYNDIIITRIHPREANTKIYNRFLIDKNTALWEALVPQIDIEDKILIGIFSTAQVSPKIIFNKEPVLIFLYRIENNEMYDDKEIKEIDQFISIINEKYVNKNRIYIPKSYSELEDILNKLAINIGNKKESQ